MIKIEDIIAKIDASKEILSTLPKNNTKNINAYTKKLEELKLEFTEYEKSATNEMKRRIDFVSDVNRNSEIALIEQKLVKTKEVLYLLNNVNTSFEKMSFDKAAYDLRYYYKKNLEVVSNAIFYCIKKLKETGVRLNLDDFCYSKYAREYLTVFFEELNNPSIDYGKIKNKFEEIYWECSNIIIYIELNIRYLYFQNEKNIDKYYAKMQQEILKNDKKENIFATYAQLKKDYILKTSEDKSIIVHSFLDGTLNPKDFVSQAMNDRYFKFISKEVYEKADENKVNEIDSNIKQLLNSVYEYKNYLSYKFIIDNVKKIYSEKEKYKNTYLQMKKNIAIEEKKIIKLDSKKDDKLSGEQDALILKVKEMYRDLEKNKVYYQIITMLKDSSTISDVLYLASSFYGYISDCMRDIDSEVTEEEVEKTIQELREFILWPYSTILSNTTMLENKDILIMIKDRYQLLGINLTKEDLNEENLEGLLGIAKNIDIGHNIRKNNIDIEEIKYICDFKKNFN